MAKLAIEDAEPLPTISVDAAATCGDGFVKYRPEIDALRAFAVLSVIVNHFDKTLLPSGYLGVDVFFVISGYVITSSLHGRKHPNLITFLTNFLARRIKRLMPALVFYVLVTSCLICFVNPHPREGLKTGLAALLGCSNHYLYHLSTDYFAQAPEQNPFTHTWSLGVEEQFYIVYPFLFWCSSFSEKPRNKLITSLVHSVVVLGFILSLAGFVVLYDIDHPAAYFLMPTRFWEFSLGIFAYKITVARRFFQPRNANQYARLLPVLTIVCMFGVMLTKRSTSQAVPATMLVALLTGIFCILKNSMPPFLLANRNIVYIGNISYSLYLWHWGVLSINRWTTGNVSSTMAEFLLTGMMGAFSYRWIETPSRKHQGSTSFTFTSALGAFLLTAGIIVLFYFFNAPLLAIGETALLRRGPGGILKADTSVLTRALPNGGFDSKYTVEHSTTVIFNPTRDYCQVELMGTRPGCVERTKVLVRHIFTIGDSHAGGHYPSIAGAVVDLPEDFVVKMLFGSELSAWLTPTVTKLGCGKTRSCLSNYGEKLLTALQFRRGDIVVVSFHREKGPTAALIGSLEELCSRVISLGGKVVLVDAIPDVCERDVNFQHSVLRLGHFYMCSVSEKKSLDGRVGFTTLYKNMSSSDPGNVIYFDPHPALCGDGVCDMFDRRSKTPTALLYSDEHGHFRGDYPNPLQNEWRELLKEIV